MYNLVAVVYSFRHLRSATRLFDFSIYIYLKVLHRLFGRLGNPYCVLASVCRNYNIPDYLFMSI